MPIYKGSTKTGNLYDQLKMIMRRFKSQLVFDKYFKSGTVLGTFSKPIEVSGTLLTMLDDEYANWFTKTNTVTFDLSKIENGIKFNITKYHATYYELRSGGFYTPTNSVDQMTESPFSVRKAQLISGQQFTIIPVSKYLGTDIALLGKYDGKNLVIFDGKGSDNLSSIISEGHTGFDDGVLHSYDYALIKSITAY